MSKLIAVSDEVYEMLLRIKKGRSFTEVIKSTLEENKADISESFGIWKMNDAEAEDFKKRIKENRKNFFKKGL